MRGYGADSTTKISLYRYYSVPVTAIISVDQDNFDFSPNSIY